VTRILESELRAGQKVGEPIFPPRGMLDSDSAHSNVTIDFYRLYLPLWADGKMSGDFAGSREYTNNR
jgi:hypothetical protein